MYTEQFFDKVSSTKVHPGFCACVVDLGVVCILLCFRREELNKVSSVYELLASS